MIQPIGGRIDHPLAVDQRHSAPRIAQGREVGQASRALSGFAFDAHGAAVFQECFENTLLFRIAHAPHALFAELGAQTLELVQGLLNLHGIVGQHFRGRVDGGQAAADDDAGQSDLQVGQRGLFKRPG